MSADKQDSKELKTEENGTSDEPSPDDLVSIRKMPIRQKNKDVRVREWVTKQEVDALQKAAKTSKNGLRDSLMIGMAFQHALRVGELVLLRWEQIDFKNGKISVIRLKGGVDSTHSLSADEIRSLAKLKREQGDTGGGFVFTSAGVPMTPSNFRKICNRAAEGSDIGIKFHPHMLRHGCGTSLARKDTPILLIAGYMGHKNIQNTMTYISLNPDQFNGLSP